MNKQHLNNTAEFCAHAQGTAAVTRRVRKRKRMKLHYNAEHRTHHRVLRARTRHGSSDSAWTEE